MTTFVPIIIAIATLLAIIYLIIINKKWNLLRKEQDNSQRTQDMQRMHDLLEANRQDYEQRINALNGEWERRLELIRRESQLQFKSLSETALNNAGQRLSIDNKTQMDAILEPLRIRLESLQKSIKDAEIASTSTGKALDARITDLINANNDISREAQNLSRALKGDSKKQGDWGEMILTTMLLRAGLKEGINFDVQVTSDSDGNTFRDENGSALRPDLILYLPQGDSVIVDSKVSMTAYLRYMESKSDEERLINGKAHVASVKKHIQELSAKNYPKHIKGALDHVLMFIPNEPAWILANELDHDLWKYADDRKITIVSLTHILSVINITSQLWRKDNQDKNAAEIARIAGLMYDSLCTFLSKYEKVGASIDASKSIYNDVHKMLEQTNSQSLVSRAKRIRELGAKTSKNLDNNI